MTCSVQCLINSTGTHTTPKGTRPSKPVRWDVSIWLVKPDGEKNCHSMTVPSALMFDLVPLVNERVQALITEHGSTVISAGWLAHGRGSKRKK